MYDGGYNGDPRETPYVPEPKYFDKLPAIFAKAKSLSLSEQADVITKAIDSALRVNKNATTARVGFRADPVLIRQLLEQDVTARIDGNRTILNW